MKDDEVTNIEKNILSYKIDSLPLKLTIFADSPLIKFLQPSFHPILRKNVEQED